MGILLQKIPGIPYMVISMRVPNKIFEEAIYISNNQIGVMRNKRNLLKLLKTKVMMKEKELQVHMDKLNRLKIFRFAPSISTSGESTNEVTLHLSNETVFVSKKAFVNQYKKHDILVEKTKLTVEGPNQY